MSGGDVRPEASSSGEGVPAPGEGASPNGAPLPSAAEAAVEAVRGINLQGRAVALGEILAVLAGRGFDVHSPDFSSRVVAALTAHPELSSFESLGGGPAYHDPSIVSATYARILDRKASPIRLMAEEIRVNSREYPRPVPVDIFEAPPFSLTPDEIAVVLPAMAGNPEYADIACAVTSEGALYLYSTQSLDPAYAEFLAEHAYNLARNP